ncbi:MAG: aminoacyl-tRNA deacylase [Syntrophales bacterium]|nr:aminoacyl-tRNA deacylase [Syntrophales bacterium]
MKKENIPMTPAIRLLKEAGQSFTIKFYRYQEKGGTKAAARELKVDEHIIVKTIVMEDESGNPFLVLMHGDREVSTKSMARILGVKKVYLCDPKVAEKHTGYKVGGTSPFGTKKKLPVYVEETIMSLPYVLINAGGRGILAELSPKTIEELLNPVNVNVAI